MIACRRRRESKPQVMSGEVIEIVEGVLGEPKEVLGFLLLQPIRLDGNAQREDRTACLEDAVSMCGLQAL